MTSAIRALVFVGFGLSTACAMFQSNSDSLRDDIVDTALDQIGEDYKYGGADPDKGFDCSGLVYYSYGKSGMRMPRTTTALRKGGRPITLANAKPADLLFYDYGGRKNGGLHVVIYLGNGKAVHAPASNGEVEKIDVTAAHWRKRYLGAVTYIKDD